jgi:hypothetical protein
MRKIYTLMLCLLGALGTIQAQTYVQVNINQAPQRQADAGSDLLICPWEMPTIGGTPAALGGTPSYTYFWSGDTISNPGIANPVVHPSMSSYYILMVTDSAGCTAYDSIFVTVDTCVGMPDPAVNIAFSIFPNPNQGKFKAVAKGEFPSDQALIIVSDMQGRIVAQQQVEARNGTIEQSFQFPSLSKSMYQVQLQIGDLVFSRKMIIQ